CGEHHRRLLRNIFKERQYLMHDRPVENDNDTVNVTINLALQQIIDLTWNAYNLKWIPEEYGNITTINLPSTRIWTPDILLYN
ncbi:unnamed protein product, partial [Didymodactylos carnosus]